MRAIRDRFVGYRWASSDRNGTIVRMKVLDARAGRVVTNFSAFTGASIVRSQAGYRITDVVLRSSGEMAWAAVPPAGLGREGGPVGGARRSAHVAASPDIEPGSVAMSRAYVYWRQAGSPMSASLP